MGTRWGTDEEIRRNEQIHQVVRDNFRDGTAMLPVFELENRRRKVAGTKARKHRATERKTKAVAREKKAKEHKKRAEERDERTKKRKPGTKKAEEKRDKKEEEHDEREHKRDEREKKRDEHEEEHDKKEEEGVVLISPEIYNILEVVSQKLIDVIEIIDPEIINIIETVDPEIINIIEVVTPKIIDIINDSIWKRKDKKEEEDDKEEKEDMGRPTWSMIIPFIFISEETSGVATREVRSWGPAPSNYTIKNIKVVPFTVPSAYHKLAIVLTNYEHITDATFPSGSPVFVASKGGTGIGATEQEGKIRWPAGQVDIPHGAVSLKQGDYICVVNEYENPATTLLDGEVIITIEDSAYAATAEVTSRETKGRDTGTTTTAAAKSKQSLYEQGFRRYKYGSRSGSWSINVRYGDITPQTVAKDLPSGAILLRA